MRSMFASVSSCALALFAWSPAEPAVRRDDPVQPNILLIVLDDVGTDKLAMYGETPSAQYRQPPYCSNLLQTPLDPFPYPSTPVLDHLASGNFTNVLAGLAGGGIRFNRAYASSICNPGRACMLTGRYGFRNGMGVVGNVPGRLSPSEVLLPELLRTGFTGTPLSPYVCGAFGKWHLSGERVCDPNISSDFTHPTDNGWFDFFQGTMENVGTPASNPGDHFNWTKVTSDAGTVSLKRYEVGTWPDPAPLWTFSSHCRPPSTPSSSVRRSTFTEDTYTVSVTGVDASTWINAQTQPFFAYVAFNAPHSPFQVPPYSLLSSNTWNTLNDSGNCYGPYCAGMRLDTNYCTNTTCGPGGPSIPDCQDNAARFFYNAMLESVDTMIGRLIQSMSEAKRAHTIVIVMGDNGTPQSVIEPPHDSHHGKGSMYELGVRVPLIVAGYGVPEGGATCGHLVHAVDLWKTIADLTDADETLAHPLQPLDSISFLDSILHPQIGAGHRTEIFCQAFVHAGPYEPTSSGPYEPGCVRGPNEPLDCCTVRVMDGDAGDDDPGKHSRCLILPLSVPATQPPQLWKLIALQSMSGADGGGCNPDTSPQYTYQLYNIDQDPHEATDRYPDVNHVPGMASRFNALRARMTQLSGL